MHAQSSISSKRQLRGWARHFLGTGRPSRRDTDQPSGSSMVNTVPEGDVSKRMSP